MVIIASQHRAGKDPYEPQAAWPEDTYVQWGGRGVVLKREGGGYGTAFFEAFPKGGGFIRGEGPSIAEAEAQAHATWVKQSGCRHIWGRNGYTNGLGLCRLCRANQSRMFKPIVTLGAWKDPISAMELDTVACGYLQEVKGDRSSPREQEMRRHARKTWLRCRVQGIDLPPIPEEPSDVSLFEEAPYARACREAVCEALDRAEVTVPEARSTGMAGLFAAMSSSLIRSMLAEWREERDERAKAAAAEPDDAPTP